MNRILRVDIVLDENQRRTLAYKARGFYRENPQKAWSTKEYQEAARLAIQQLALDYIKDRHEKGLL